MKAEDLLQALGQHGVAVYCHDEQVKLTGPVAGVPPTLLAELRARKEQVLHYFRSERRHKTRIDPLSLAQVRLDYVDQLRPNSAAYVVAASLRLHGEIDRGAIDTAWRKIEAHHEALRSCLYRDGENSCVKCVDASVVHGLPACIDLRAHTPEHAALRADDIRTAIATTSFDLQQAPLWRCALIQLHNSELEVVFAIHHLITDGWSLANMLREFAELYRAAVRGETLTLSAPESDYASYGAWQRAHLNSDIGQAQQKWWANFVDGYTMPIALPLDHPRPATQSDRGGRVTFRLDATVSRRVRDFAAEHNITLSELVSAVHAVLLHLYSGTTRFLLGMAVSTRPSPAYRHVFGFFVNWLPVPADFRGRPSFTAFLTRWCQARRSALAHQDTPYDAIVRAAHCRATSASQPLFQHMMVSHVPARQVDFAELHAEIEPLGTATAKVDLTLFLADSMKALPLSGGADTFFEIEFSADLFERQTVELFARDLRHLLTCLTADPERRVMDWTSDLVAPLSCNNMLTGPMPGTPTSPVTMLAHAVRRYPDTPAIVQRGQVTSYRQFWQHVIAISANLRDNGLQAGDRVALCAGRTMEMLAAFVAIIGCEAIVVPLDPALPPERLAMLLNDSCPALLLCGCASERALLPPFSAAATLYLDRFVYPREDLAAAADFEARPAAPAYLLYTSGSTGTPKGVLGTQGALSNFIGWLNTYLDCGPGQRVLAKTSIGFDASMRETLAPLCAGATVVLADDASHGDPEMLAWLIAEEAIELLHCTPTVYRAILSSRAMSQHASLRLRHVMCGGEALTTSLASLHYQRLPDVQLYNVYGPTECTIDVLVQQVMPDLDPIPLGRPLDGAALYLADPELNAAPLGTLGEILIAGPAVGPGYWRRPEEEAKRFITPERGPFAGKRVFRTGDLAYMNCRGELVFAGRTDRQIKNGGARVELEEIEAVVLAQPEVVDVAVLAQRNQDDDMCMLIAFIVLARDKPPTDVTALHRRLARRLPTYMRPSELRVLEVLPRLPSGKRDWQSLAALSRRPSETTARAEPMTPDEQLIADLMAGLLGIPVDDRHLDFFRAGGHSLNAARLLARVRKQCGVTITLRELFADASVLGLAELVRTRHALEASTAASLAMQDNIARARRPRGSNE
jgi:amino acid adenylation domain-containing protein